MKKEYASGKLTEIFKQRQIGTLLGFMKIVIGNISPYATWISLALIGVTSFYTTLSPVFQQHDIPFPFWLFCVILFLILAGTAVLEWVFMMPSYYRANNLQAWDAIMNTHSRTMA